MDEKNYNQIIIGRTTTCVDPNCSGWFVDTFSGKYWIKCNDPKHNKKVENGTTAASPTPISTMRHNTEVMAEGPSDV